MRIIESVVLITAIVGGISWTIISAKDGYKQNNAMIVTRSIEIYSTIDGEIENEQLAVGSSLNTNDMMVKIKNTRIDRSRLTEFQTKVEYLKQEIKSSEYEKVNLDFMMNDLTEKSKSYKNWLIKDLQLTKDIKKKEHLVATNQMVLKTQELNHAQGLFDKKMISSVEYQQIKIKTDIADNQLKVIKAELAKIQFALDSTKNDKIFFESGDESYWNKTIDTLRFKTFENERKISELRSQLKQYSDQETAELSRLNTNYIEEHRAPFPSVVNSVYVTKGSHIKSGTTLMQVLDCSNPIVVVPIPETRFSDFTIGKEVIINPIDSEESLTGTIQYISSGPLISLDKTIALQQELTAKGNHAVISFDSNQLKEDLNSSCDSTRRAIVTIKTHSMFNKINEWIARFKNKEDLTLSSQIE